MDEKESEQNQDQDELTRLRQEIEDYSEREKRYKLVAKVLRDSEIRFRRLFEKTKDAYYVCKPNGQILDINPAGIELLGYVTKEEFLFNNNMNNLYQNPRNLDRYYELMEAHGYVKDFELILKKRDGDLIFALVTAIAVKDKNEKVVEYRGVISDDTDRIKTELQIKRLDVELMIAHQQLEEYKKEERLKPEMIGGGTNDLEMGKELSNPIGDLTNSYNILKNYHKELIDYMKSLEWLVNHIEDYDETIFLVKEIHKIQKIKRNKNINYILEDSKKLFESSSKNFKRISSIIGRLKAK
jgi:PAS domain S-box-containing protein